MKREIVQVIQYYWLFHNIHVLTIINILKTEIYIVNIQNVNFVDDVCLTYWFLLQYDWTLFHKAKGICNER
jgi:hypothetical protein